MSSKKLFTGVSSGTEYVFLSGFFPRAFACFLDLSILFFIVTLLIKGLVFDQILDQIRNAESILSITICGHTAVFLIILLYFVFFEAAFGVTPGKYILKIKTTDLSGNSPTLLKRIFRNCIKSAFLVLSLSGTILAVHLFPDSNLIHTYGLFVQLAAVISLLMPGFTEHKQTFYDKWAQCLVYRKITTNPSLRTVAAASLSFVFLGSGTFIFTFYTVSALAEVLDATDVATVKIEKRKWQQQRKLRLQHEGLHLADEGGLVFDQGILPAPKIKDPVPADHLPQQNQTVKPYQVKVKTAPTASHRLDTIATFVCRISNLFKDKIRKSAEIPEKIKDRAMNVFAREKSDLDELYQLLEKSKKPETKVKNHSAKVVHTTAKKKKTSGLVAF